MYHTAYRTVQRYNCGTSLFGLVPSALFFVYSWRLSDIYVSSFVHPGQVQGPGRGRRRRRDRYGFPFRRWTLCLTKNTLTFILVWSSGQLWSEGLLRCLDVYTLSFLTLVNDCLEPAFKLDRDTLPALEPIAKSLVCYWAVAFLRWAYLSVYYNNRFQVLLRRHARLRRIYHWHPQVREIDELGEDGRLLIQNVFPPETVPAFAANGGPKKLPLTQSCVLFAVKKNQPSSGAKTVQRRRSI